MWFNLCMSVLVLTCVQNCETKPEKKSLNVLTYNVMLHESSEEAYTTKEVRKRKIIRALKNSDADVVCLQEVFIGQDVEDIVDNVKGIFPFSFSGIHDDVNDFPPQARRKRYPPCDYSRLIDYLGCVGNSGCLPGDINCITSACQVQSLKISENDDQGCLTCIATSMQNIFECASEKRVVGGRQMNDGGLLLLSKRKLTDVSFNDYHPTTKESFFRGYIKAEIEDFATVVCTHLKATDTGVFYEPDLIKEGFSSLSDVHTHQTRTLIRSLRGVQPAIILGDLNTGLAFKPGHIPKIPENYVQLLKRFTTRPATGYTYVDLRNSANKCVIDHVFVRNLIIRKTKRKFVPKRGEVAMSDHVGVQSVVKTAS